MELNLCRVIIPQAGASGSPLLDMATSSIYAIQAQSTLSPEHLFVSFPDLTPATIGFGNKAVPTALFFDVLVDTVADLQTKQGKSARFQC